MLFAVNVSKVQAIRHGSSMNCNGSAWWRNVFFSSDESGQFLKTALEQHFSGPLPTCQPSFSTVKMAAWGRGRARPLMGGKRFTCSARQNAMSIPTPFSVHPAGSEDSEQFDRPQTHVKNQCSAQCGGKFGHRWYESQKHLSPGPLSRKATRSTTKPGSRANAKLGLLF
jgi:hypothetical protein